MSGRDSVDEALGRERVLRETKWLAAFIIPFLAIAVLVLFLIPERTDRHFAWPLRPTMSAMMLGATYLSGIFFFVMVIVARRWQHVRIGFLPVTTFATLLGIATIIHWDRFSHSHVAFWMWAGLYFTTPFLVLGTWLRNSRAAGDLSIQPGELTIGRIARIVVAVIGFGGALLSLVMFVAPDGVIDQWPWTLSPLTSRVMASVFAVYSVFAILMVLDPRWESVRVPFKLQIASPPFFLLAVLLAWNELDQANPWTWIFIFNVAVVFVIGLPALYFTMEARRKRRLAEKPVEARSGAPDAV